MKKLLFPILGLLLLASCNQSPNPMDNTTPQTLSVEDQAAVIESLGALHGEGEMQRIDIGVKQAAAFWTQTDGDAAAFKAFCASYFTPSGPDLELLFQRLSENFEVLWGSYNKISLKLQEPVHLDIGEIAPIDRVFAGYSAAAHLEDDLFANKIAFICLLNFPFQTLGEKNLKAKDWSRQDWAYARMGEVFSSRVPAELKQVFAGVNADADAYISDYNIYMGNLRSGDGEAIFPEDLRLITHWGLRDELKANYNAPNGLVKQRMIYQVMLDIIRQDIPKVAINNPKTIWDPFSHQVLQDGEWLDAEPEGLARYQHLLEQFEALKAMDDYNPLYPTYIQRKFDQEMELPQQEVEDLFVALISSDVVKQTAEVISQRLGRPLEAFDIWYDGFKTRSTIPEEELNSLTQAKYPDRESFQNDLPNILVSLGFDVQDAMSLSSQVIVDPSRGAGHAWGAAMRSEKAHLRTRIGTNGMDYKGYNIAVHEFGHTVEQTISLQDMDYYMLNGVPNTSFTEALAFVFQKQDMALLGIKQNDPLQESLSILDHLWSNFEIMGVSLVDMRVWKWLYAQEGSVSPEELKSQVITIATEVWNEYYAPVFGLRDTPILAVYSHMIDYPLYLSAYPLGELIQFQIEEHLTNNDFASEVFRMYRQGRISPKQWMMGAVGEEVSITPLVTSAQKALSVVEE